MKFGPPNITPHVDRFKNVFVRKVRAETTNLNRNVVQAMGEETQMTFRTQGPGERSSIRKGRKYKKWQLLKEKNRLQKEK